MHPSADNHNPYLNIWGETSGQRIEIVSSQAYGSNSPPYAEAISGLQPHGSHVVPYSNNYWNAPHPQRYRWPRAQPPAYYPAAYAVPHYQRAGYQTARAPPMIAPPPQPASPRPPPERIEVVVPVERRAATASNLNLEELSTLIVMVVEKLLPPANTQMKPCCCKRRRRDRRPARNPVNRRGRDLREPTMDMQ